MREWCRRFSLTLAVSALEVLGPLALVVTYDVLERGAVPEGVTRVTSVRNDGTCLHLTPNPLCVVNDRRRHTLRVTYRRSR